MSVADVAGHMIMKDIIMENGITNTHLSLKHEF
jgi:hypothetical protein